MFTISASGWDALRRYGKGRKINLADQDVSESAMPTVSGRQVLYPIELAVPTYAKTYTTSDPYKHLGPIGYTTNTWRTKEGPLKIYTNLYMGFSRKKSGNREEARRIILAESKGGLPRDIDADSVVSKAAGYFFDGVGPDRTQNMKIHRRRNPVVGFK